LRDLTYYDDYAVFTDTQIEEVLALISPNLLNIITYIVIIIYCLSLPGIRIVLQVAHMYLNQNTQPMHMSQKRPPNCNILLYYISLSISCIYTWSSNKLYIVIMLQDIDQDKLL
jgi:hypothetical protein